MVVEELIAKLGFKVDGLEQVKKFDKSLESARRGLEDFGKAANKSIYGGSSGNPLKGMADGMSKTATMGDKFRAFFDRIKAGAANTAVSMARFGVSVAGVLARIGGGAAIVGQMAIALFKMAAAAALAASKAAILRREQQMSARQNRTTAANIDKLSAGMEAVGLGKDKAKEFTSSIAEKVNESIADKGSGGELTKTTGVRVMDERHRQRDSAAIALDLMKWGLDRRKAAEDARAASDRTSPKNKGYNKALAKADRLENANRRDFKAAGIYDAMYSLPEGITFGDFSRKMKEMSAFNPPPSKDQEDRSARIAENATKLQAVMDGLQKPFSDLQDAIVDKALPPLIAFGSYLTSLGKRLGIINESADEKYDRQAKEEAQRRAREPFDTRKNFPQNTLGAQALRKLFGFPEPAEPYGPAYDPAGPPMPATPIQNAPLPPRRAAAPDMGAFKPSTEDVISGLAAFAGAMRATTTEVQSRNGPAAVAKDTQAKVENDLRKYENIGNDQRTISVSTTVNQNVSGASAPAAAGAAVSGAASAAVSKASNASTGAAAAP